jgi:hypothetical protein
MQDETVNNDIILIIEKKTLDYEIIMCTHGRFIFLILIFNTPFYRVH